MGARKQLASIVRCSCDGEMPPVIRGGSSAQQTSSPVVSTSMSCAQSSGVTMSCADSSHATPSHAQYRGQRQQAGGCHRAVAPRARAGAAAPPPPAAPLPHEPSGGSSASGRCVAQRPRRCRSRRLTEPLRQLAQRYRRPPPIPGYYRGRAERRARRCAREAASTAPAGPYRRYMAVKRKKNRCSVTAGLSL